MRISTAGEERAQRIENALVDDLYRRAPVAQLGFGVGLVILASLVLDAGGGPVRVVVGALAGLVVLRLVLVAVDRGGRGPFPSTRSRKAVFLAGIVLTSIGLAALNVTAYPRLTPAQSALLGACQTGAIAAGLASLGSSASTFALYAVPNLGSLMVMAALDRRGWGETTFLLLLGVYTPAVLIVSLQQSRARRRTAELEQELSDMALRDPLTGLFNRRFLDILLEREAAAAESSCRAQDRRKPTAATAIGLLVVDMDHFKSVNDVHGHEAGDVVLREVGATLKGSLRPCDEVVRWGGEEFVVVLRLPWEDRSRIERVADRLLVAVRNHAFRLPAGVELRCTASIGFALHPLSNRLPNLVPWAVTLRLADAALYLAKSEGRDRAIGASAGPEIETRIADVPALIDGGLPSAVQAGVVRVLRSAGTGRASPAERDEAAPRATAAAS